MTCSRQKQGIHLDFSIVTCFSSDIFYLVSNAVGRNHVTFAYLCLIVQIGKGMLIFYPQSAFIEITAQIEDNLRPHTL